jgi:hypothetical protein
MKKIYTIFILSFLLIGCSENDPEIIEKQNPTIENISNNTASVGDIISINGNNFNPNENYIIRFNNVEGEIIEIISNLIRVQIPENATTGNITFTFNNQTTIIGELTIDTSTENLLKLYATKDFPGYSNSTPTKFIEINPTNGNETDILDLETNQIVESLVFDEQNGKIIGVSSVTDENDNITNKLFIIDISTNILNSINLSDDVYYELSLSNEGKLFAIKDFPGYTNSTPTKFIEIDPANGNETDLLDLDTNQIVESLVFDEQNSKVIGVSYMEDESGNISNKLFNIDITTNTFNSSNLSDNVYFELSYSN